MSVIFRSNHPKNLWPGVQAWFGNSYKKRPSNIDKMFEDGSSDKAFEEDVQTTSFGYAPVKAEGSALQYDSNQQGFIKRYNHLAYALGYAVTREELRDGKYEAVSMKRAGSLGWSMGETKNKVAVLVYDRAFTAAYAGADGKELCATDHPDAFGGSYSNESTAAALSEAAIEDMLIDIMGATNDRGLPISLQAKCLIVPSALAFSAQRILKSELQNDTANNAVNVLRLMGAIPEVVVETRLASSTAWFIRTDCPDGMKFIQRDALEFEQDNDFGTKNALASAYERYSVGHTDPRGLYGNLGA